MEAFTNVVAEFDNLSRLDPWKTTMLVSVRVLESLAGWQRRWGVSMRAAVRQPCLACLVGSRWEHLLACVSCLPVRAWANQQPGMLCCAVPAALQVRIKRKLQSRTEVEEEDLT